VAGNDLISFLHRIQQECGGQIPFERFMQEALHHPDFGYYSAHIRDVGSGGDFSTSATLGTRLGKAIAAWITNRARSWKWNRIPVIEIGAGGGQLAETVLGHLDLTNRWRTQYTIVESSPVLCRHQKKRLRWKGVRWASSLEEALQRHHGRALIFSNELVDAFPCRLFQKRDGGWSEIGVRISPDGSLSEIVFDQICSDPWTLPYEDLPPGQRLERHESYRNWLTGWAPFWREGSQLTIDYGDTEERIYERRPSGTLRAYWKHQRLTGSDLYARFGRQDLTADVNFSDLMKWGHSLGWNTACYSSQSEFLYRWNGSGKPTTSNPVSGDAEEAFRVLEQTRGISPQIP